MENFGIQTTQNVQLNYRMASIGERILAYFIDMFIIAVIELFLFGLLRVDGISGPTMYIVISIPFLFYHLIFENVMNGQSLGKKAMQIKVIALDGSPVTFGKYLIRWVLRLMDIGLSGGFFAVITIIASKKGQRIGDLAAGTSLISTKEKTKFDESVFVNLPDDYKVTFPQAADLEYKHLKTLIDVIKFYKENPEKKEAILMVYKTRKNLETRFGISTEQKPVDLIETVIKDFNALIKTKEN